MAAPTKSFTTIPDTQVDANSPAKEDLFTFLRDNGEHNDERIGIPTNDAARQANHAHKGLSNDGSERIDLSENIVHKDNLPPLPIPTSGSYADVSVRNAAVPDVSQEDIQWFDDSASTLNDITATVGQDDSLVLGARIMDEAADFLYIGAESVFTIALFIFNSVFAAGAVATGSNGAIIAEYFNGTSFVSLSGVSDGTASGGNTFHQDGDITWTLPTDWLTGAQAVQAGLDSSLLYARFSQTNDPTLGPQQNQSAPKLLTAKIAKVNIAIAEASDVLSGIEFRRNGATGSPSTWGVYEGDFRTQVEIPLDDNETFEHRTVGSPTISAAQYVLAGFIT